MSQEREDQERPCLHCMMVELIDDFLAEHPATAGSDKVDTGEADEVLDAIAKTVAEVTSQQGLVIRQVIEELMRQICITTASFVMRNDGRSLVTHEVHAARRSAKSCQGACRKPRGLRCALANAAAVKGRPNTAPVSRFRRLPRKSGMPPICGVWPCTIRRP